MHPSTIAKGTMAWLGLRPSPISLAYELSWLCNLECTYCDRHTPMGNEMAREQIFKALGEFVELGTRNVTRPLFNATRAVTIHARPEQVWPWLAQIGYKRDGFRSWVPTSLVYSL